MKKMFIIIKTKYLEKQQYEMFVKQKCLGKQKHKMFKKQKKQCLGKNIKMFGKT